MKTRETKEKDRPTRDERNKDKRDNSRYKRRMLQRCKGNKGSRDQINNDTSG